MSVTEKRETRELLAMEDFAPTTCFDPHLKPMYFDLHVLSAEAIREIGHVNSKKRKKKRKKEQQLSAAGREQLILGYTDLECATILSNNSCVV